MQQKQQKLTNQTSREKATQLVAKARGFILFALEKNGITEVACLPAGDLLLPDCEELGAVLRKEGSNLLHSATFERAKQAIAAHEKAKAAKAPAGKPAKAAKPDPKAKAPKARKVAKHANPSAKAAAEQAAK